MKGIKSCRVCGSTNVRQFFDLGKQPFANALLYSEEIIKEKRYPLSLSFCNDCALVQLDYTADPKELFSHYFWVTGTSSTAKEYAELFYQRAIEKQKIKENGYVMEIASNDGTFLKPFKNGGYQVLGIDPAENITKKACESGIRTETAFFGTETAKTIIENEGFPDIIFARNVLPHVADVNDFVEGLSLCCEDDTLAIIEIHYAGIIADELHYDSIYHEHLCYFSYHSVEKLLNMHGLYPYDISFSPISGGSIVLYVRKRRTEFSKELSVFIANEEKKGYSNIKLWEDFANRSYKHGKQLRNRILSEVEQKHIVVGYGASARSSTMLNFARIDDQMVECIIDKNELKQGKLTPGTHIPIVSVEDGLNKNPDIILLLAWNFKDEVIDFLKNHCGFHGTVIIPLPNYITEVVL